MSSKSKSKSTPTPSSHKSGDWLSGLTLAPSARAAPWPDLRTIAADSGKGLRPTAKGGQVVVQDVIPPQELPSPPRVLIRDLMSLPAVQALLSLGVLIASDAPISTPGTAATAASIRQGTPVATGEPIRPAHLPKRSRHTPARADPVDLTGPGYLRLEQVLTVYPVSRAAWYAGLGTLYPTPVKLGKRSVGWRTSDIRALVEKPPFAGEA